MHNLHLLVVIAETGKEACDSAEAWLEEWGTENNWRCMCGAVSQDDEVFVPADAGRFPPDDNDNTIEKINKMVAGWVNAEAWTKSYFDKLMAGKEEMTSQDWWGVKDYAKHMVEKTASKDSNIDVLDGFSYFEYSYDEIGVTQLDNGDGTVGEGEKKWVVFVDMHS